MTGKVVRQIDSILEDKIEHDRNGLSTGIYFIELRGPMFLGGKILIDDPDYFHPCFI